jgi:HK97 family phage major capsid protein
MSIKNLDALKQRKDEIMNKLADSVRNNDTEAMSAAMNEWQQFVEERIMEQANGVVQATDRSILAARGVRQLTTEETKFYEEFIASAKQEGVITNITSALPLTTIDAVMEDIKHEHPLLDHIDFTNTGAATKWVLNAQGAQAATWDELNTELTKKLSGALSVIDVTACKLSAYMFCTQDMLDLGPVWVDAYCRAVLTDALAAGLETGLVDGNGLKQPTGMTRNFAGSFNASTGYARKTATAVTSFDVVSYGALLANLAKDANNATRAISRVILICNPADYFTKILPATTLLTAGGEYRYNVLPFPTDIIQSVGVESGHAVIGIAKNYFMGLGTSKGGKLEYSDDYKFTEDLRTYKIKLYGNGRAKDINSFLYLDISNLSPLSISYNANVSGSIENTPQTS